jgi:cytochrome P450
VHTCIGANLARIEARAAISEIVQRLPGLRLADQELKWQPSLASRALEELRIEYDR